MSERKVGESRRGNAGKGRQSGVPNKVTAELKDMILGALEAAGGQEYLQRQATANPVAFLSLVGKVLPLQVTGKDGRGLTLEMMILQSYQVENDDSDARSALSHE